jgi:DNA-binding NarL/FixJ family response regulator
MTDQSKHTAVVLDRHPLWIEALDRVLMRIGVDLVGKATSPARALEAIDEHRPDLFITELETDDPAVDGLACVRRATEVHRGIKAIVLSAEDEAWRISEALRAGAVVYVVKTAHPDDIASAVRQAFDHSVYLPPMRAAVPASRPPEANGNDPRLTKREQEILRLVVEGHSNAQLARLLWVTEQTVKFHLSNIYRKLDVANRTEAARWAQVHGVFASGPKLVA